MSYIQSLDLAILIKLNHFFASFGIWNKIFAEYLIYLLPILLLILWFWPDKKENRAQKTALRALFCVILAWPILASLIGHLVNRPRPFNVSGVHELVFHRPDYSFPSDHAAALFAVSLSFYLSGYKKLSYFVFLSAIIISFFRIATGIHWPTDIFGGLIVGFVSALIIHFLDSYLNHIYNFVINIAKKVKLA